MDLRRVAKQSVLAGSRRLGVNRCVRSALRKRLLVLCYHAVVPDDHPRHPWRTRVATRAGDFRAQLALLRRLFNPISPRDLLDHLEAGTPLPPRPVLVTFDDGFRNNLTRAVPELERLEVPALFHLTTGHIGGGGLLWTQELDERIAAWPEPALPLPGGRPAAPLPPDPEARWRLADAVRAACKRLPDAERIAYLDRLRGDAPLPVNGALEELYGFLDWDEARELVRRGFSVGSHTVSHPILTAVTPDRLRRELEESRAAIESEVRRPCPWLAYPNGGPADVSPAVVEAARTSGYRTAFALAGRVNPPDPGPLGIDRVGVPGEIAMDAFHARLHGFLSLLGR